MFQNIENNQNNSKPIYLLIIILFNFNKSCLASPWKSPCTTFKGSRPAMSWTMLVIESGSAYAIARCLTPVSGALAGRGGEGSGISGALSKEYTWSSSFKQSSFCSTE